MDAAADIDDQDDAPRTSADDLKEVHERAMRRFDDAVLPQIPVRELALLARKISVIPGALWEGAFGDQFEQVVKLDIHKLDRALRKARNDYRQNRIVPDFRPAGGESDKDTADTLAGLHRADSQKYKAQQARDNAFDEMAAGGFGAYRLSNPWADPLDKDSDHQRVNPGLLIPDADQCVWFGPSALYDKSDVQHAFVGSRWSVEDFKEEYGSDKVASWPEGTQRLSSWDWYRPETVFVCEYYEIEKRDEWVLIFTQEISKEEERHWQKEIDAEAIEDLRQRGFKQRKRKATRQRCRKYILSGAEVLEDCGYVAGGQIPIVPMYANRAYVDGVEWFTGLLTSSKIDAARLYASMVSRLAEIQALSPHERPILTPEQVQGHEESWARGNINRSPYQLINPQLDPVSGGIATLAPVGQVAPTQVPQTLAALLEIANRDVTEDDEDGAEEVKANTSADAMDIAAARVDAKSGVLLDNNRQSVQREGELYLAMACEVYAEDGRVVETMSEDGDDGEATLHEDYSDNGTLKVRNNFATGKYKVVASVTEATATRRDRTVKASIGVASVAQEAGNAELANACVLTAVMNMDGEGIGDLQKFARKQALQIGLVEPNEDEQRQAEEAAQAEGQQPDPQMMALQAQIAELQSKVGLNEAKTDESKASTMLKVAQAQAVGGPEEAPAVPDGLTAANDDAKRVGDLARADLHTAQADKIRAEIPMQRIKTGHQIELERRQQDHAEKAAANG